MSAPISNFNKDLINDEVELIEYIRVIRSYKLFITIFILLGTCLGFLYASNLKAWYSAETTIMPIDSGGGSGSGLSGLAQLAGISVQGRADNSKDKITTILKSRKFMERLVLKKNLLPIIFADIWDKKNSSWKKEITSPPAIIDGAYYLLGNSKITLETPIIKISVETEAPETASLFANTIVEGLNEELQEKKYTMNQLTLEFVKKQLEINKIRLEKSEEEFVSFQKNNKMLHISQADKSMELLSNYISLKGQKEMEISSMKKFINNDDFNIRFLETDILGIDKKIKELEGRKNGSIIIPVGLAPDIMLEFERKKRDVAIAYKIYDMLLEKYEFFKIEETKNSLSFQIIDDAITPQNPFKPQKSKIIILFFFASSFTAFFLVFFWEYLKKIK